MTGSIELSDLSDPLHQRLVHPLDLPAARGDFMRGYWTRALMTPGFSLVAAGLTWFIDANWVRPLIVFVATALLGWLGAQYWFRRAWAHIPLGRHDVSRPLPLVWELAAALLHASVLSVGVFLIAHRLLDAAGSVVEVGASVRAFTVGVALAATVMALVVLLYNLLRATSDRRATLFTVPPVLALLASVALVTPQLLGPTGAVDWAEVGLGAAMMLVVGAGRMVWSLVRSIPQAPLV